MLLFCLFCLIIWSALSVRGFNITSELGEIFPDRNDRQRHMKEFASSKRRAVRHPKATELGAVGHPIKLLFWNANMGFEDGEVDFAKDPSWTMDCPVDCLLSNRREVLEEAHVVVYLDMADKNSYGKLDRQWQRSVVYARTPVMYYQERELQRADWLVSFNEDADVLVDNSQNSIMAALYATDRMDLLQEELLNNDPLELWTRMGLMGKMPELEGRINNTVAVFLEDCVSFDGRRAKTFVEQLQKQFSVHTYGACFRENAQGVPPTPVNVRDARAVIERMQKYRFVLVVEHTRVDGFVSEMLYYALAAGAIPIYVGAPNIIENKIVEGDAVVWNVESKKSAKDLGHELHRVKGDDGHWQRYQWWRGKGRFPMPSNNAVTRRGEDSVPCQICKLYKHHLVAG